MPTASSPKFRQLAIVTAVLATLPAAFAQQGRPSEPALPPPSLYDELMPPERAAGPAPAPTTPAPAPQAKAPPPAPAPAKPAQPASVPARQAKAKEPWYKSMFSWMGSSEAKPAQSKMMAAPSSSPAAYTAGPTTNEYALYDPNKVVRGGYGQCVRTGWWRGSSADPCGPGAMARQPVPPPTQVAAAAPTPVARPEPVEVQPLAPAPVREERALEVEPAAVAAPAPAPVPAPPPPVESMTLSADALFALSSATLKPAAMERLDQLATRMLAMDYQTIRVVGHTDPTGSPEMNEKLSLKRAEAVKRYLVAKGVDPNAFVIEGMGSAMPMVTDKDCGTLPRERKIACYQPDRRVEIEVIAGAPKTSSAAKPAVARN
jgi:OOP family OmpA-OmpF porin